MFNTFFAFFQYLHINIGPCIVNKPCTVNAVLGCPRLDVVLFMQGMLL